jgi:hypothetical protein
MSRRKDWTGQKFNRLTFVRPNPEDYSRWTVRCDCGTELEVISGNVRRGLTKSCGCLNLELLAERNAVKSENKMSQQEVKARDKAWREKNREQRNAKKRAYNEANKERLAEVKRQCYLRRRDAYLARIKANYEADPEQSIRRERLKATLKKEATPSWCDMTLVKALYRHARAITKETGVRHHVDHIVPLRHDLVCGLHVHNNLRVIPADENWRKHNSFDPDLTDFTPMCHFDAVVTAPSRK